MDVMADLINRQYVEHKAWFRCPAPSRVDAGIRSAVAGPMEASIARYRGFDYYARASGPQDYLALVVLNGEGAFIRSREQMHFARGDVMLLPSGEPFKADMRDFAYSLVRIPRHFLTAFAEEHLGVTAGSTRIESMAPRSRSAGARWSRTAAFICEQLLDDHEGAISPILAQEVTRMAVATVLEVFPSTAMTSAYTPDPSWAPPATVRRATAFMHAYAGRPISVAEIAESAGVTPRALQYAFRRHYETTVTGYLRQVRLEQAHRELRDGDSAAGATVTATARRWGWASPGSFASAYRRQYGVTPSRTLRT
jgi:AraC-like DNA-binding protein